jgi:tRNA A-37 threonylcarbamoyl transferase component Bud32
MMAAVVQCPNPGCGRVSHLGDDPLGRIFRCPRCLTKLPAAADSGWTTVLGPPRLDPSRSSFGRSWAQPAVASAIGAVGSWGSSGSESGDVLVGAFNLSREGEHGYPSYPGLGPDDSGEVCIEPFSQGGSSVLGWGGTTKSSTSTSAMTAVRSSSTTTSASLQPAKSFGLGRFRIMGVLGEGEHATVYRAYDPILERDVALKVPRQGVLKTAKALVRFLGEAKALARLRHPRIVPVYEAGCAGHRHFIAMALIEGRNLAERLAEGPLALRRATEIVAELAEALAYAHAQGVVHRDVKPANVRIDDQGAVYLMDFGIAYHPDSGEVPLPPGMILGTPAYIAPEQAQGGQPNVLPASDQYSLGVVLYELLCGQPPFCGPPSYVLFHAIHLDPPSPHTVVPGISRSLAAICMKALAKNPERRYADCQEFAGDLRRWLRGETPLAHRRTWARLRG